MENLLVFDDSVRAEAFSWSIKMNCSAFAIGSMALAALLTGCATVTQPQPDVAARAAGADSSATPVVDLPAVKLTSEMVYELLLADIATQRGHFDVAAKSYEQLAQATQDPRLAEQATRLAIHNQDQVKGLALAKLWVAKAPANLEARQVLAVLLIRSGQPDAALEHMEKVLTAAPQGGENAFMVIAGLLSREEDKHAAVDVMRKFIASRRDNPEAQYAYSFLAARAGAADTARQAIDHVLELKPDWLEAQVQRVRILKVQGKSEDAIAAMKKVVDDHPQDNDLRISYARMLVDEERFEGAYEQFKLLSESQPDSDDILFALGFLALQTGHLDDADRYLTRLHQSGRRPTETPYYLGRLEELRGNQAKAVEWYSSLSGGENYLNARIRMAVLKAKSGDISAALSQIASLRAEQPDQRVQLALVEGEILFDAERFGDALAVYDAALKDNSDNTDLLYSRSMAAEKLNRISEAESDLRKILEREPNNAEVLNALGYTLADKTDRYDEALAFVDRALRLRPKDHFILDSMGWVHYRLGRYEEAVKYLRRALDLKKDAEVAAHLGEVLWVMGSREDARNVWQQALDSTPDAKKSRLLNEVMKKFDSP